MEKSTRLDRLVDDFSIDSIDQLRGLSDSGTGFLIRGPFTALDFSSSVTLQLSQFSLIRYQSLSSIALLQHPLIQSHSVFFQPQYVNSLALMKTFSMSVSPPMQQDIPRLMRPLLVVYTAVEVTRQSRSAYRSRSRSTSRSRWRSGRGQSRSL